MCVHGRSLDRCALYGVLLYVFIAPAIIDAPYGATAKPPAVTALLTNRL